MKKNLQKIFVTIVCLLVSLFCITACGKSKVEFKVNFVVDGEIYATLNTSGEEIIKMPENPTKDDYDFDGWYWDKDTWQTPFTANSLLDAPLSSDMNVYCKWKPKTVRVSGISLNKSEVSLRVDETEILTATITPANATDKSVLWESSNASAVAVENGELTAMGYGSAVITATTVDSGKTATCAVEVIKDTITFKTLQVAADGETVYGKVSNATTTFSFLKEIEEQGNATYQVYKEITCETLIASKSISLNVGDNTVYILQTVGKDLKLYTVTVRRRPIYNVSFDSNGGTAVQSQQVEEDHCATAPASPRRIGYTFARWNYDFSQAITKNSEIKAVWTANTDTKYKTEYYLQNLENDKYTLHETSDLQGTTDTKATAEIKNFAHFTHKATATDSGNIAPDGSLVLKVYYTRDKYNVTFESNGGTLESGKIKQILKYEGSAVAPVFTRTGYTFIGWDKNFSSVDKNITITAQWKINQYTLTLVFGGVRENEIITQDYNSMLEIPNPDRAGYDFIAWDKAIPDTMPDENITRTAQWNAIFKLSENGDTITGLSDYGKNKYTKIIVIPAEIDGIKIISIGDSAFSGCSELTNITIPNSITTIGKYAFYNCSGLTSITIPDSVTSIGYQAFDGCSGLQGVYITYLAKWCKISFENISSNPLTYAHNLYLNNTLITDLVIPYITSVNKYTFSGCDGLTSVTIPDSVKSIGSSAFSGCSGITNVIIGNSVTSIGYDAFDGCSGLKGIYIADLEKWCKISFENPSSNPLSYAHNLYVNNELTTELVIPYITSVDKYMFYGCSGLKSVTIPDSVTSIGSSAFKFCSGLEKISVVAGNTKYHSAGNCLIETKTKTLILGCKNSTIPTDGSVTSIGDSAFEFCSGLTSITIPNSVTSIGSSAFYNCSSLTSVIWDAVNCTNCTISSGL